MDKRFNLLKLVLVACSRASLRIGYRKAAPYPFVNCAVKYSDSLVHEGTINESLLRALGIKVPRGEVRWQIPRAFERDVHSILEHSGHGLKQPLVGLNTSPAIHGKGFQADLLNSLIRDLLESRGANVVLFYQPEEETSLLALVQEQYRNSVTFFACVSVGFATAMMKQCSVFITLNNVLYQFAALLNVKTVALFRDTEKERWANRKARAMTVLSARDENQLAAPDIVSEAHSLLS